mgnify:CR=1 FL=1
MDRAEYLFFCLCPLWPGLASSDRDILLPASDTESEYATSSGVSPGLSDLVITDNKPDTDRDQEPRYDVISLKSINETLNRWLLILSLLDTLDRYSVGIVELQLQV